MRCPSCSFENPEGMNFCGQCASPLAPRCPQCGFENPAGFAFCGKCATPLTPQSQPPVSSSKFQVPSSQSPAFGLRAADPGQWTPLHLAERILAEQAALEARGTLDGERKTITALFADTAGFTALAQDLDPEDTRAIIDPALQLMMDAVHRYEGYVAQSLGDGIFALFGAPIAHEDHAQRALYAALRMQEEMRQYAGRIRLEKGVPLEMRVGINTGEVVLRSIRKDDLHTDYVPVGHSVNLASRMESLARPGSIVASEHTYKLIEGYFECKALGAVQVKGLDEPVTIYEVLGVGPLRTRQELSLLAALGLPVQITQGYGRAEKIYTRAQELCQQVGENPHLSSVLWGAWVFYLVRADLQTARDLGQQLLTLAQKMQDALNLAQNISHPLTLGTALAFAAHVYRYCNEPQIARERAEAGVTLCTEYGFPYWSAFGILTRGWDLVRQGQIQEGIAQIH